MYPEKYFAKEALNFVAMLPHATDLNRGMETENVWSPPTNKKEISQKGYWYPWGIISVIYTKRGGKVLTRKQLGGEHLQVLMVDSGGFQLKRHKVKDISAVRTMQIQNDIGDIGFLIDVADTHMLTTQPYMFEKCIEKSVKKADIAYKLWDESKVDLYMTVHGGTSEEKVKWHDTVAKGREFSGIAFGNVDFPDDYGFIPFGSKFGEKRTPISGRSTIFNRIAIQRRRRFLRELDRLYMAKVVLGYDNLHYFGMATHNQKMDSMLYSLKKVNKYKSMRVSIDSSLFYVRVKQGYRTNRVHNPYSNGQIAKIGGINKGVSDNKCNCAVCQENSLPLFDEEGGNFVVIKGKGMVKVNPDGTTERIRTMERSGTIRYSMSTHNVCALGDWHDLHNNMTAEQIRDTMLKNYLFNDFNTYLYIKYIDDIAKNGFEFSNEWFERNMDLVPTREEAFEIVCKSMNRLKGGVLNE